MKIFMAISFLFLILCSSNFNKATIRDRGKVEIGSGLYLKKLAINGDRVYLLVDANDKLISTNTACSYTVGTYNSSTRSKNYHTESNSVISQ